MRIQCAAMSPGFESPSLASDGVLVAQADGDLPEVVVGGVSPGDDGVAVVRSRFAGSAHIAGTALHHVIYFNLGPLTRFDCRMADRRLDHVGPAGSFAIAPAHMDVAVDTDVGLDTLALLVSAERLAQGSRTGVSLVERLSGGDPELQRLAEALAEEAATGYGDGPLYWSGIADRIVDHLVERHLTTPDRRPGGGLSPAALARVTEFIRAHLDERIEVDQLASVAARSRFHFSRAFARSVGMSPHRYVMQQRLERAFALMRGGRLA